MIHPFRGKLPNIHTSVYLAGSSEIIGDVTIGKNSSVWFNTVVRGDVNHIRIGEGTNIQDGCILHVHHDDGPLMIGSNCTLGHGVIAHACTIHDHSLIGMGAIILDNAKVNSYTLVAAGTLIRTNDVIPEGVLVAGVPAKIVRELSDGERKMIEDSARNYIEYAKSYKEGAL